MVAIAGVVIGAIGLISSILSASNQTEAAKYAVGRQLEIANRVQAREDEFFYLWDTEYKWCELNYARDVFSEPILAPDRNTAAMRAVISVKRQFARAESDALKCLPTHCVGAASGIRRSLQMAEASAAVWASTASIRQEEERVHALNTRRHEEMWRAANIGHGAYFNTAGSFVAAEAFGRLSRASERAAGEASNAAGYYAQQLASGLFGNGRPARADPVLDGRPQGQAPPDLAGRGTTTNNVIVPDNRRRDDALFDDRDVAGDWGI